jgi:hypothetical protein
MSTSRAGPGRVEGSTRESAWLRAGAPLSHEVFRVVGTLRWSAALSL